MTDAAKARLLLGGLFLAIVASGAFAYIQNRRADAAERQAAVHLGRADAAAEREAQAKAAKAAADQLVRQREAEILALHAQLAQHPAPPPARPVPPDAPAGLVVAELQGLGLAPRLLPDGLALSLPDGRTTLGWGREAQRVPQLAARLGILEELTRAQADQAEASRRRGEAADQAIAEADARADAQERRAEALQRAIDLRPRWRPSAAGVIVGVDSTGSRHLGAYATHAWGPLEVGALYINRTAGLTAAIRF